MSVKLEISDEDATLLWCQFARARKIGRDAIESGNTPELVYSWSWIDCCLDQLMRVAPEDLAPDGNETQKP